MRFARICFVLFFSILASITAQAEGQRVILVLDASGSMWGQINGTAKMDIAKDVVGKVISGWKPEDEIGLVAYGHRKKGACDDIETLITPGTLDAGQFMSTVKALNAKGKTPMTQAVRQAAEALKFTEKQATVILVSDGIETCDPNPCAVAEELEKMGIGLTVHTVGFGLDDKGAVDQLKCLAERTGGMAVLAENAEELEGALKQTVEAKVEEPAPTPPPAVDEFNLHGHVVMAAGVELPEKWNQPSWTFHTAKDMQEGEYLSTEYGANMKGKLTASGPLLATIQSGRAKVLVPFTLDKDGKANIEADLDAGLVDFKAMVDDQTPMDNDGAAWTFSTAAGEYIGTEYGKTQLMMFNAGDYKVKLDDRQASAESTFTVVAGKTVEKVVSLGAGTVRVNLTYTPGGDKAPDGTAVELRKPAGLDGEGERLATEYGSKKIFRAPAGDYVIVAIINLARAEIPVKIESGKELVVDLSLNAGFLSVREASGATINILAGEANLEGKRKRLTTEYGGKLDYVMGAGAYRVQAIGAGDVVLGEKDITIVAGKRLEVTLP